MKFFMFCYHFFSLYQLQGMFFILFSSLKYSFLMGSLDVFKMDQNVSQNLLLVNYANQKPGAIDCKEFIIMRYLVD